jgi:hypothetical protein
MPQQLALAEHPDHPVLVVGDGEPADPRARHLPRRIAQRNLRAHRTRPLRHDVANGQMLGELVSGEGGKRGDPLRRRRGEQLGDHLLSREQTGEGADDLEVRPGHARRRDDEQHDARALLLPPADVAPDRRGRDAERDGELLYRLRPVVEEEGTVGPGDDVLGPLLRDALAEHLGSRHRADLDEPLDERPRRGREERLLERDDDPVRGHHVGELHMRSFMSETKSAGRWAMPIPAARNASIFSFAVPCDPEMIAPA